MMDMGWMGRRRSFPVMRSRSLLAGVALSGLGRRRYTSLRKDIEAG